jgi:hypothetical protein
MPNNKKIFLFVPYYFSQDSLRQNELNECLAKNEKNTAIEKIILLIDDQSVPPFESDKFIIKRLSTRPTYADWVEIVEEMNIIGPVVLANSDIYFDESIQILNDVLNQPEVFVALSRWEVEKNNIRQHSSPHWSQDVWAFNAADFDMSELRKRLSFKMGVPRCDNKIAYVFATSGWSIRNPCNFIRTYHLHESQLRNYDKKLDTSIVGGVTYVEPSLALDEDSALHFDIWSLKSHKVIQVKINNNLEIWRNHTNNLTSFPESSENKSDNNSYFLNLRSRLDILRNGKRTYRSTGGMSIYEKDNLLLVAPTLNPREWTVLDKTKPLPHEFVRVFFKPAIDIHLSDITERPKHENDVNFWQYPCRTEHQALENHKAIADPVINQLNRNIKVYVALPWATYIDNKHFPLELIQKLTYHLSFLKEIATRLGYKTEIYSVCQHIRWKNILKIAEEVGITDLAISHCTSHSNTTIEETQSSLRIHPWTLYAVNYCDKNRNKGLVIGKPIKDKKYLASFIGAHMPHYLSDIRIRLCEGLSALRKKDIVVKIGDLWHFNKIVYDHQVGKKNTSLSTAVELEEETLEYNRILSNSCLSLCPEGAGPNTLRFWESIAVGAVPVLFNRTLKFPQSFSNELSELCLFWEKQEFGEELYEWLGSFSMSDINQRSKKLIALYKKAEHLTCF